MLDLLAKFCARPFWRAQIFNTDKIGSGNETVLVNSAFNPVSKVAAHPQRLMQGSGARNIGFTPANASGNNGNNSGKVVAVNYSRVNVGLRGGLRTESAFFDSHIFGSVMRR